MSHHSRSARPITGIYFIALQIYMLSEDCLLSQSIRSSKDTIQLCNIQYMSHQDRPARPITGIYFIALQIYTLSEDRLLSQSIQSGRDAIQLCSIQYIYAIFNTCPLTVD
ncbi:hypothetical protein GIB67_016810 [Kingdonia uniflora]|uniref:Uncharacterized protein n=1 Tax=Kingdonia uniflora TaxID=39325 RepID=A0A7J7LRY8_9MAGN|nr:hypothetical protein GIB67_016810 [Kingdonia uniflora]